ncbi:alpha/beta hydrolase [Yoonia sp. SS1-5]|uniref:Alpha/beta hydrolase n=1 Tax=Yoonia rhodophyticola TaxID=3137370 RepID=A0AAN0MDL8_9RHOB
MELDDAYANATHIPGGADYPAKWAALAQAFRDNALCELDLPYGETPRQRFDLFHPSRLSKGLIIFVHGGYWLRFDKSYWSHLAAGPLADGWSVAMPSYDLCPDVRISQIGEQIGRAIAVIGARVAGPVRLCGHSAGGQLVARHANAARVENVVSVSPVSDLAPLQRTRMNADLRIDAAEARTESPVHLPPPATPVTVWVGGAERPAFLDQAKWLAEAWNCTHVVAPGAHHFNVIEALADPQSPLTQTLVG